MKDSTFRDHVKADLARAWPEASARLRTRFILTDPGSNAVFLMRVQLEMRRVGNRLLERVVHRLNLTINGFDWVPGAKAGPGLIVRHPVGIVVGRGTVIGADVTLLQNVTLGQRHVDGRVGAATYPAVEDGVTIGVGACVLGGVRLGAGATVGANAVVVDDVAPEATALGIPARVKSKQEERRVV